MGFVNLLLFYLKLENGRMFLLILVMLVELVDEFEVKYLEIDVNFFEILLNCLNNVIYDCYRRFKGWFIRELVRSNYNFICDFLILFL